MNVRRISPRNNSLTSPLIHAASRQLAKRTDSIIREGNDFQVKVDDIEKSKKSLNDAYPDRDTCIWQIVPNSNLTDDSIVKYCRFANQNFNINMEQALFILANFQYDIKAALKNLKFHFVVPEKFSEEDQSAFRFAYSCYGKNFSKIRQMISHKSMSALVQHYYNTKKYQMFKSTIDTDNMILNNDDSEDESCAKRDSSIKNGICENCKNVVRKLYLINELELCTTCKMYFLSANQHRPCKFLERPKRRVLCPDDMRKTAHEFLNYAQSAQGVNFEDADDMGELQIACKKVTKCEMAIQNVKDEISKIRANAIRTENQAREEFKGILENVHFSQARAFLEQTASAKIRLSYSWQDAEKLLAFQALISNNRDFAAAASLIGTKTADMLKSFYYDECQNQVDKVIQERCQERINLIDFSEEFKKLIKPPEVIVLE